MAPGQCRNDTILEDLPKIVAWFCPLRSRGLQRISSSCSNECSCRFWMARLKGRATQCEPVKTAMHHLEERSRGYNRVYSPRASINGPRCFSYRFHRPTEVA
jgi:hypothetical protein